MVIIHVWVIVLLSFILVQISGEDKIDCIDIYKQPAFQHELLKNHKIQERPSEIPRSIETKKNNKWQTWEAHVSTARCPEGTVPIRNDSSVLMPTTSTDAYLHEYAVAITKTPSKIYGAKATISVWDPLVEKGDELSLSQIWITSGSYEKHDINSIEVGWQVLPNLYQDNKPRLFIYWTSDAYDVTGCYNLQCSGFIQTSRTVVIGGTIAPVSIFEGSQFEIIISVWKTRCNGVVRS